MEAPSLSGATSSTAQTQVRIAAPAAAPAVKTELPDSKTVNAIGGEPAVRLSISDTGQRMSTARQAMQNFVEKHVSYDEELRTIVIKSVDQNTGKTVSQVPDEISLKLRAYMRDAIEKMEKAAAGDTQPRTEAIA